MRNWKRIIAAAGTAALLISNMGAVSQAVFADNADGWKPVAEGDTVGTLVTEPAGNIKTLDPGDDHDAPVAGATTDKASVGSNALASQGGTTALTEASAGSAAESGNASRNETAGVRDVQEASHDEQQAGSGDAAGSVQEIADQSTTEESAGASTASTEDKEDAIEEAGDATDDTTVVTPTETPVNDATENGDESVVYALNDSLVVELETRESDREVARDGDDHAYLYDLGETAYMTVTISNPEEYVLEESDDAIVRVYMQFTDNEANAEENAASDQDDSTADVPDIECKDSDYEYNAYEIEPGLYCYAFDRPIHGDHYEAVISGTYGEDTDGGEAGIWAVLLTAEDAAALDEKAAAKDQDASDDEDTDREEQADTEEELDGNTDDVDADDIIGVADPPEENELLTLRWCKDSDEDTEEEPDYPSFQYSEEMSDGTVIDVDAPEGAFPEGIRLALEIKDAEDYLDAIRAFTGDETLTAEGWLAYDFDFYTDEEHHNIEPETDIKVTFSNLSNVMELAEQMAAEEDTESADVMLTDLADEDVADNNGDEGSPIEEASVTVYHIADAEDGQGEVTETTINNVDLEAGSVEIETDTFSAQLVNARRPGGGGSTQTSVDHIDIDLDVTAAVYIGGKQYTSQLELVADDYKKGLVTITAVQNGSPVSLNINYQNIDNSTDNSGKPQKRLNGTFPIGTTSNPVWYTWTMTKDVTFNVDGKSVVIPITFTTTFKYFQSNNVCPGLMGNNASTGYTSRQAGMDYEVTGTALAIQKEVRDADTKELIPVQNYTATFDIANGESSQTVNAKLGDGGIGYAAVTVTNSVTVTERTPTEKFTHNNIDYQYVNTTVEHGNTEVTGVTATGTASEGWIVTNYYRQPVKNIRLLKHALNNESDVLEDAKFTLTTGSTDTGDLVYYKADGTASTDEALLTTDATGVIEIHGLAYGIYTLTEVKAPDGYNRLTEAIRIVISENGVTYGDETATTETKTNADGSSTEFYIVKVANEPGYELPETGGTGTVPFEVGGSAAILGAMCIGYSRRRRGRKEGEM